MTWRVVFRDRHPSRYGGGTIVFVRDFTSLNKAVLYVRVNAKQAAEMESIEIVRVS